MFLPGPEHKNEVNRLGSDIIREQHFHGAQTTFAAGTWIFHGNFPGQDKLMNSNSDCDGDCECSCASYNFPPLPSPLSQLPRHYLASFHSVSQFLTRPVCQWLWRQFWGASDLCSYFPLLQCSTYLLLLAVPLTDIFRLLLPATAPAAASSQQPSAFLKGQFPIVRFDFISKLMKWHKSIKTTAAEAWHRSKLAQDSLLPAAFEQWQCAVINTLTIIPCSYWKRWKLFIVHWSRDWLQDQCAHF